MDDLQNALTKAVEAAVVAALAAKVSEIAIKETNRALVEHEDDLTRSVKAAVASALAKMLKAT